MGMLRINKNPSPRDLTLFGLMWLAFLGLGGILAWWRHGATWTAAGLGTAAVLTPALGWLAPGFLRAVYLAAVYLTAPIGYVMSWTLLAVIYYLLLTPIGLLMRLFGHDPMCRGFDCASKTYWIVRNSDRSIDRYFHQF